nr:HipA family kinase [Arthrobacter citreus]
MGLATDGNSYWVKYLGNAHGIDSLIAERVVEALARKLSAPMRPSMLVEVPPSLLRHPELLSSGIQAGVAHGSLLLGTCQERTVLDSAARDGNAARQPRFIALWELCYGEDGQWLYDRSGEEQVWSFDHGYWITGGEPAPLTPADLEVTVNQKRPWYGSVRGMDPGAFLGVADDLALLSVTDFIDAVASVPVAWGVPDSLLETLAWWLHYRRKHVVTRMRALATEAARAAKA